MTHQKAAPNQSFKQRPRIPARQQATLEFHTPRQTCLLRKFGRLSRTQIRTTQQTISSKAKASQATSDLHRAQNSLLCKWA